MSITSTPIVDLRDYAAFAIEIDFVKGKGDPSRPFRTMVELTEALSRFDKDLVKSVDTTIEPVLILENVEAGSIKSWFLSVLNSTDDTALQSGDWKKIVGSYAVRGKYALLKWLNGAESAADPKLLESIQAELLKEAEETKVRGLPGYAPMSRTRLAAHIADITSSLEYLDEGDSAQYESPQEGIVSFNRALRVVPEELTEVLATRTVVNENEMILKVKKPDFLGSSMWEFRHDGHAIEAKMADTVWLKKFHDDGAGVLPGSALRARVRIESPYDMDNEALPPRYTVIEVLEVLPPPERPVQPRLLLN
jgi:hypothetical protein